MASPSQERIAEFVEQVTANIERVMVGKRPVIELLLAAMLCEGHVLLEDVPGTGKTMLARSLAVSLGGAFKRVQCTPDLLPNDLTGVSVFNQQSSEFEFRPGPLFVNVLLADEINRATPRTQSALLEAMQEQQVTVDGVTHALPQPFLVLATQNPIEYEGTFPLPEAQLDRFLIRLPVGYPGAEDERRLLQVMQYEHPIHQLQPLDFAAERTPGLAEDVAAAGSAGGPAGQSPAFAEDGAPARGSGLAALLHFRKMVWDIHVDDSLQDYLVRLVGATRSHPDLALGASPRAMLGLFRIAQALAAVRGRDHVLPDDIKLLAPATLGHRLLLRPEAELRGRTVALVLNELLDSLPLEV